MFPEGTRIYRCSDGHVYSAPWALTVVKSLHLGFGTKFQRCPVDGRWRIAKAVDPGDLSPAELLEAESNVFR
jgi:hypothetical protein